MKKEKRYKRSHGTVTVFLTLILVPCIIFTCAFGDVSRVQLSQSQATAASDLALYSLMANYDENLKEWYGLVSSCQTIDSFYSITESYFKGMMVTNGFEGLASQTLVAYLEAARNGMLSQYLQMLGIGAGTTDFLQVDGLDTVKINEVTNGAMGSNPALIEDGIVEFMKYRGPVVILSNVIERFQLLNLSGDLNGLTEANENEPIVEAKQEYAEAESAMMNDFLYSYLAILQYINYQKDHGVPVFSKYQNLYTSWFSYILDDLAAATDLITKFYAATYKNIEDIQGRFPKVVMADSNLLLNSDHKSIAYRENGVTKMYYTLTGVENSHVGKESSIGATYDEENDTYYFTYEAMEKIVENLDCHVNQVQTAAQNIVNACQGVSRGDGINDAVYCKRIQDIMSANQSNLNTIRSSGNDLMKIACKLYLAQCWELPYPDPLNPDPLHDKDWRKEVPNIINRIAEVQRNYLSYSSPNSAYENILSSYASISANEVQKVNNLLYEMPSELMNHYGSTYSVTLDVLLKQVRTELGGLQISLKRQIKNIDTILTGGEVKYPNYDSGKSYTAPSLDMLKLKIENMANARNNWGSTVGRRDSQYAREEQEEYENPSLEGEKWRKEIADLGGESVEELRTRLMNIRADMQALSDVITGFTYGGVEVCMLTPDKMIEVARSVIPTSVNPSAGAYINLSLSENSNAAKQYHSRLVSGGQYTPPRYVSGRSGNETDLNIDPPKLFETMREELRTDELENAMNEKDRQEKKNKEKENEAKEKSENAKKVDDKYLEGIGTNLKEINEGFGFDLGTALTGVIGVVKTLVNGNFDEFRDQIYVVSYIMEMFTWSTYNNEGQYKMAVKDTGEYDHKFDEKKHGYVVNGKDYTELWKNQELTFTNNKSLTNKLKDKEHNRSNLGEVEYILYGKQQIKENINDAYGQIFWLREALNLISGFQYFYNDAIISAVATGIMAATCGLIPEAVTKVVLIGLLSTFETINDMNRLKAGTPVAIYKKKDQWRFALTKEKLKNLDFSGDGLKLYAADPNGLYYSDYMLIFLMIACQDTNHYKTILLRVGDLIEGNVELMGGESFDLEKSQCYFQLTGDIHVKPLLLELPIVENYEAADSASLLNNTGWCTYHLKVIRGYS